MSGSETGICPSSYGYFHCGKWIMMNAWWFINGFEMDMAHLFSDKAIEAPYINMASLESCLRCFEFKGRPFGCFFLCFSLVFYRLLHLQLPTVHILRCTQVLVLAVTQCSFRFFQAIPFLNLQGPPLDTVQKRMVWKWLRTRPSRFDSGNHLNKWPKMAGKCW